MPGLGFSTAEAWAQESSAQRAPAYRGWTLAAIAALTGLRLVWLAVQPAGLYPDEAQYWVWAKHLAFGYYSKPPLVAWAIALTTGLFGDSEFAVRLAAPLLHAVAAGFVYATGARLYDSRVGFWSAVAYASLPGVSISAFIISTDAVLLPCWAAALYAFIRAREPGGGLWWLWVGVSIGLGMLAKYAMAYWLLAAFGWLLAVRDERRHLGPLLAATGIGLLIWLPNLWWNWDNGFVSFMHLRDNADLTRHLFHPSAFAEFLGSQFGIAGPLVFAALLAIAATGRFRADRRAWLLATFALPALGLMLCLSFLSRAEPNWAAPTYISAVVLIAAVLLEGGWRRWLRLSVAINLLLAVIVFGMTDALASVGVSVPAKLDPLHRLRGWRGLGQQVGALLAAHPNLKLLADDREVLAALTFYVRPHPFGAVEWNPIPGITDEWRLVNNIGDHRGEDFLAVTVHNLAREMRPDFAALIPLTTITTTTGPNGGRTYKIYIARDFRGSGRRSPAATTSR